MLKIVNVSKDNLQVCSSVGRPSFLMRGESTIEISEEAATVHYGDDLAQFEKQGVIRIEVPTVEAPPAPPEPPTE